MPIGTPVHERTLALCESLNYREWSGYYAVSAYRGASRARVQRHPQRVGAHRRLAAFTSTAIDGRDAARFVNRIITRDVTKMSIGQVFYTPWCDEHGKVIDDGTVARLAEQTFRWTAADPSLRWFRQNASGLDVTIEDISEDTAALALQGPTSAKLLRAAAGADIEIASSTSASCRELSRASRSTSRAPVTLAIFGYEIWMPARDAVPRVGRADRSTAGRSTSNRPACSRSTSPASRRGCC